MLHLLQTKGVNDLISETNTKKNWRKFLEWLKELLDGYDIIGGSKC